MKLLADENLESSIVEKLQDAGHNIAHDRYTHRSRSLLAAADLVSGWAPGNAGSRARALRQGSFYAALKYVFSDLHAQEPA